MSLLISQSNTATVRTEEITSEDGLGELREANIRLQVLVCELLTKNQQLRFQRTNESLDANNLQLLKPINENAGDGLAGFGPQ